MKNWNYFTMALLLLILQSCGGGPGTTPDSVSTLRGCYYGYGSTTCSVVFDDGQPGFTVQNSQGRDYICKGRGL